MMPLRSHHLRPLRDLQQEPPASRCACCGGELYRWESIYYMEGEVVCQDCLTDYARQRFAPCLTPLEELMPEVIRQ